MQRNNFKRDSADISDTQDQSSTNSHDNVGVPRPTKRAFSFPEWYRRSTVEQRRADIQSDFQYFIADIQTRMNSLFKATGTDHSVGDVLTLHVPNIGLERTIQSVRIAAVNNDAGARVAAAEHDNRTGDTIVVQLTPTDHSSPSAHHSRPCFVGGENTSRPDAVKDVQSPGRMSRNVCADQVVSVVSLPTRADDGANSGADERIIVGATASAGVKAGASFRDPGREVAVSNARDAIKVAYGDRAGASTGAGARATVGAATSIEFNPGVETKVADRACVRDENDDVAGDRVIAVADAKAAVRLQVTARDAGTAGDGSNARAAARVEFGAGADDNASTITRVIPGATGCAGPEGEAAGAYAREDARIVDRTRVGASTRAGTGFIVGAAASAEVEARVPGRVCNEDDSDAGAGDSAIAVADARAVGEAGTDARSIQEENQQTADRFMAELPRSDYEHDIQKTTQRCKRSDLANDLLEIIRRDEETEEGSSQATAGNQRSIPSGAASESLLKNESVWERIAQRIVSDPREAGADGVCPVQIHTTYGESRAAALLGDKLPAALQSLWQQGLYLVPMPALGKCFYASISMCMYGTIMHQDRMRQLTVAHMRQQEEKYTRLIQQWFRFEMGPTEQRPTLEQARSAKTMFEWYTRRAAKPSEDAREPELTALAEALELEVQVFVMLAAGIDCIQVIGQASRAKSQCRLLLTGKHYDALLPTLDAGHANRQTNEETPQRAVTVRDAPARGAPDTKKSLSRSDRTELLEGTEQLRQGLDSERMSQSSEGTRVDPAESGYESSGQFEWEDAGGGYSHNDESKHQDDHEHTQRAIPSEQQLLEAKPTRQSLHRAAKQNSGLNSTKVAHPECQEQAVQVEDRSAAARQVRILNIVAYGKAYTDGGSKEVRDKQTQQIRRVATYGIHAKVLVNGKSQLYEWQGTVRVDCTEDQLHCDMAEFHAAVKSVQLAAHLGVKYWDIVTDSETFVRGYEAEELLRKPQLIQLMKDLKQQIQEAGIILTVEWVKGHAKTAGNIRADALATEAREKRITEGRQGPLYSERIVPPRRAILGQDQSIKFRSHYQTYPPYQPLDPNHRGGRRVEDLITEQHEILYFCPVCEPGYAMRHSSRKALLKHLREEHGSTEGIPLEVEELFGITSCARCKHHYAAAGIKQHQDTCSGMCMAQRHRVGTNQLHRANETEVPGYQKFEDELLDTIADTVTYTEVFAPIRAPKQTIWKLNYKAQPLYTACQAITMEAIIAYSGLDSETKRRQSAWIKLEMMLPNLILYAGKDVAKRARLFLTGSMAAYQQLLDMRVAFDKQNERTKRSPPSKKLLRARRNAKVSELIKNNELGRALQMGQREQGVELEGTPAEILTTIRAAYPVPNEEHRINQCEPIKCRPAKPGQSMFSMGDLKQAIRRISAFAGSDLTGHRAGHWKPAFRGRREMDSWEQRLQVATRAFFETALTDPEQIGDIDFWSYFTGGKITVIPSNGKLRSVGSQNFLYKVYSQILAMLQGEALKDIAGPAHLGSLPSGIIAEGVLASCFIDLSAAHPEAQLVISRNDGERAFPNASRSNILRKLQEDERTKDFTAPAYAWVGRQVQRMVYPSRGQDTAVFLQAGGIVQGETEGSKKYNIGSTNLIQALQDIGGSNAAVTAIVDDITVHGTLDAVIKMEQQREELEAPSNYIVNKSKQRIYVIHEQHLQDVRQQLEGHQVILLANVGGVTIGGTPLGGDEYCHQAMKDYIEETSKAIQSIMNLDSRQEQLLMLRSCIPGRINHLVSVVPPGVTRQYAEQHDQMIHTALKDILGISADFTDRESLQLQRKLSNNGFGFRSVAFNLDFMFLSGFARSVKLLKHWPMAQEALSHAAEGEGAYGSELYRALDNLIDIATLHKDEQFMQLLPTSVSQIVSGTFEWNHQKIQQSLDKIIERRHDAFYDPTNKDDEKEKAIMKSTDHALFHICPRDPTLTVSNEELQYSAQHALGRKTKRPRQQCRHYFRNKERCTEILDAHDIHLSTCRAHPVSHQRHAALQEWCTKLGRQAGMRVETAPLLPMAGGDKYRKADIIIRGASLQDNANIDGGSCVVDVTCVTAAAEAHLKLAYSDGQKPLKEVEDKKVAKYQESYRNYEPTRGSAFVPLAITTTGSMGRKGQELVGRLCEIISRYTGQDKSVIQYHWKARLLVLLAKHRSEAATIHEMAQFCEPKESGELEAMYEQYDISMDEFKKTLHGVESGQVSKPKG